MKTRLEEHYHAAVRPALMEKFGYKNTLEAVSYTHLTLPTILRV